VRAGGRRPEPARPKGKPAEDVTVSPALVQILAEPGRVDGRKIGIIANAGSDLAGISTLVKAAAALGVTALVIAPVGGVL
jgi:catalase